MKKFLLGIAVAVLILQWNTIKGFFVEPPDFSKAHGGVVLYATDWCGYCAKTRALLQEKGISFFEYDVEKSQEGMQQFMALGGNSVPLMQIDGKVIRGYQPEEILKLVAR